VKKVSLLKATLGKCVSDAQREPVVLMSDGRPMAVVVGVAGMDEEQLELGSSHKFWRLIAARRKEPTMTRAELEKAISNRQGVKKR
jgi:hypothetical protein